MHALFLIWICLASLSCHGLLCPSPLMGQPEVGTKSLKLRARSFQSLHKSDSAPSAVNGIPGSWNRPKVRDFHWLQKYLEAEMLLQTLHLYGGGIHVISYKVIGLSFTFDHLTRLLPINSTPSVLFSNIPNLWTSNNQNNKPVRHFPFSLPKRAISPHNYLGQGLGLTKVQSWASDNFSIPKNVTVLKFDIAWTSFSVGPSIYSSPLQDWRYQTSASGG